MKLENNNSLISDLYWLTKKCSIYPFGSQQLSASENELILQKLSDENKSFDEKIKTVFDAFNIKEAKWKNAITQKELPILALTPAFELLVVFAMGIDGSWKCETSKGIIIIDGFSPKTVFAPLKTKQINRKKMTALEMFKTETIKQKSLFVYAAIASFSINILALGTSFYSMQVYDRVIPTQGISTLVMLSIGVFIAILLEVVLKIARSSLLDHASRNMDLSYSHDIYARFLNVRADALPKSIGTLSAQLQSYGTVRSFITSAALFILIDFPFSLLFLVVIIAISGWLLGFIALIFLMVSILTGFLFKHKIEALSHLSSLASHKKLGMLVETIENAEFIKTTGASWSSLSRWNLLSEQAIHDDIKIRHYSELLGYVAAFFQQISYVILIMVGAYLVTATTGLTMGGLIATTILSGRILSPIATLPNLLVQWGRTKAAIKDLERIFSLPIDNEEIDKPLTPILDNITIECKNIKFKYANNAHLMQIPKLCINAGEKIAIIGSVGAGKSTLIKMLNGLYKPQEGSVLLNSINVQQIAHTYMVDLMSYLPQNVRLISGTLRENLLLGLVGIRDDEIMASAIKTGLIYLINALPNGLDTPIPEGGESVSGGQKQLIALTRLILSKPKVWLLDEPTSNMDESLERHLMNVLNQTVKKEDILIVVTHKPAILSLVNRIIVMSPNGIVLDGPRDRILQELNTRQNSVQKGNQ